MIPIPTPHVEPSPESQPTKADDPTTNIEEMTKQGPALSVPMAPHYKSSHLRDLLTTFDARALGEGDEVTGANLLAAMAITLGNLARPDSGIQTPDGRFIPVTCNLLASGAQLTSMIRDEVVTPAGSCQNNFLAHVDRLLKNDDEQNKRPLRSLAREWNIPQTLAPNQGETNFLDLMINNEKSSLLPDKPEVAWLDVLTMAPHRNFLNLVRSPRVFIAAANPAMLERQLDSIHAGQALITISLNRAADAGRFGPHCTALMNSTIPKGPSGEIVGGLLLVTDPGNVLPEAVRQSADANAWLGRVLWLVSGQAGPEPPPEPVSTGSVVCLPRVAARYESAAQKIFAHRMNSRSPEPLVFKIDFTQDQLDWMTFLRGMESSLPGISGTARHLLASLRFGFGRIVRADDRPQDFTYYTDGIMALARFLVRRMANARTAMLFSAGEACKQRNKQKVLTKLSEGCLETRSIYRPLHLPATTCEAILLELENENRVTRHGRKWELVAGSPLAAN